MRKFIGITLIIVLELFSIVSTLEASALSNITISNTPHAAMVFVNVNGPLHYTFFLLHKPERIVLDINQVNKIKGLPKIFNSHSLVKRIHLSSSKDKKRTRLVFDLTQHIKIHVVNQHHDSLHTVVFTLISRSNVHTTVARKNTKVTKILLTQQNPIQLSLKNAHPFTKNLKIISDTAVKIIPHSKRVPVDLNNQIVIAIDAGHGGQDPGAIGRNGLQEKNVTIAIASSLQTLLNDDPQFKAVLTRHGDYFISVMSRSDVARKKGANVLVSIHADAAPNRSAKGASVWLLSNQRANSEMAIWLEQHEKQSELLGGAGDMLANRQTDPYLSQAVLDLQFCYSQQVSYDMAKKVLQELQRIGSLHKRQPKHASLGVLSAPDIPSLLVETGFISNSVEERLLRSTVYQSKISAAIYNGLRNYFLLHPLQTHLKMKNQSPGVTETIKNPISHSMHGTSMGNLKNFNQHIRRNTHIHVVKRLETLTSIADTHGTTISMLQKFNKLKKNRIWIGQHIKLPTAKNITTITWISKTKKPVKKTTTYKVTKSDTLSSIASTYRVRINALKQIKKIKNRCGTAR
ncbi:N-acetylmuramoyl-L-alanine amidase AmiB [Candidatus Gillettellia adelgis]